jgi:F0F1-type ATP synthase membrane subunit b/b'
MSTTTTAVTAHTIGKLPGLRQLQVEFQYLTYYYLDFRDTDVPCIFDQHSKITLVSAFKRKRALMARFRVGNVRFGGGRKASIGFHGFGVGATFGGGRRSGSGSSSSGGGYVETRDWESLTDHEKATLPLKSLRSIKITSGNLSANDKALLAYRRKRQEYQIRAGIFAAFLVVASMFSVQTPLILGSASLLSIMASIFFSYKRIKTAGIKPGVEPTDKQLQAWAFVNDDKPLPNISIAYSEVQKKYGEEAIQAVTKLTGKKVKAKRSLTFKDLVVTNFYINIVLLFGAVCAIGIASGDNSSNCGGRTSDYYSGLIWGIGDCYDLNEHISTLKGFLILIGISTLIAFTVSMVLGCKSVYKQHLTPLGKLMVKKTAEKKLTPKDITSRLKQQRNQVKQAKITQAETKLARTKELRERFRKNGE